MSLATASCCNGTTRSTGREIWVSFQAAGPALLMPIIIVGGIWTLVENGFLRGTEGANQYGADPLAG